MSKYSYGWEKLHLAMHSLAGNGTQAERLINAVAFNLIHIRPDENLPPSMHSEFEEFMSYITSSEAKGDEGTVAATVDALDEWGRKLAIEKIIGFYDAGRRQKLSATPDLSGTVLPLCLIPNSALKNAPPFKSAVPKGSACARLLA